MEPIEKVRVIESLIRDRKLNLFKIELDIRFGKRQILMAKGDEAIRIQNMINQWEQMKSGESKYLEYLNEVLVEESKNATKNGNGHIL